MNETEKPRRVFRTGTGRTRKVVAKTYAVDPDVADRVQQEAERRGLSPSCLMREIAEEAIARIESVPAILRDGCRVEHLTSINPTEGKLFITSSAIHPTSGSGPPFGWPHLCEGPMDEYVERGMHEFNVRCGGCVNLAASGVPGVFREG